MPDIRDKILGVIYGTAIGDALGWAVEFDPAVSPNNPAVFAQSVPGDYTDDTQMFRAVCEGLLRVSDNVDRAAEEVAEEFIAWHTSPENNRAPGRACMEGCRNLARGVQWFEAGVDSGGCGTAMRSMAYGIFFHDNPQKAALWAAEHAQMTHIHPMARAAAAATAAGVACLMGRPCASIAIAQAMRIAAKRYDNRTAEMLSEAIDREGACPYGVLDKWRGWAGHEAVAASLWCFLRYSDDYEQAVLLAVNSPGDSDSLGAITGALVGANAGLSGIPERWVKQVEKSGELMALGERICKRLGVV